MTRNLRLYLLFSVVWSIGFFVVLNWAVIDDDHRWPIILLAQLVYGIGFSILGHRLGKADDESKVRYSLRYAYPAVSMLSSAVIGGIWLVFFRPEELWQLVIFGTALLVLAFVGFAHYKRSIKGMSNRELFQ